MADFSLDVSQPEPAAISSSTNTSSICDKGFLSKVGGTPTAGPVAKPAPRHDDTFYLEPVTFQVGNTLFRVSKIGFLVPGTVFEAMFSLPAGEASNVEGSSDDNPIHLNVNESSFKAFLRVLYPSLVKENTVDPEDQYRNLVSALDLATMWDFLQLRKQIISTLAPIVDTRSNLEVIFLARKYGVADWLRASYKKLVNPAMDLSIAELTSSPFTLDWPTIANIFFIRETLTKNAIPNNNVTCNKCNQTYGVHYSGINRYSCGCRIVTLIDTQFHAELNAMTEQLPDVFDAQKSSGSKNERSMRGGK